MSPLWQQQQQKKFVDGLLCEQRSEEVNEDTMTLASSVEPSRRARRRLLHGDDDATNAPLDTRSPHKKKVKLLQPKEASTPSLVKGSTRNTGDAREKVLFYMYSSYNNFTVANTHLLPPSLLLSSTGSFSSVR